MNVQFASTVLTVILITILPKCSSLSLYSPDDPLHELDSSNFEAVILRKSNAWIVEFYNNWCGHCIRFAPTWKQFSRDIITWKNVIDVAVVNCADSHNVKLCRDYDVSGYPTIKIFKPYANESDKGDNINGDRDIDSIEASIVEYLESYQDENAPSHWPELHPLQTKTVEGVTNLIEGSDDSLILFIEHLHSSLGKKVIMDLSFQTDVVIRRVLMTNDDLTCNMQTKVLNSTLALVLRIDKSGNEEVIAKYYPDTNVSYIREQMFLKLIGSSRSESSHLVESKTNSIINVSVKDSVHMTDLENALRYLLYQEIGVVKHIYGDRLDVLKSFILTLKNYFPGKPPIMGYISKLSDWISKQNNITGEKFVIELDKLQTKDEFLPKMKDFIGCRGSEPRYRGYPCSLWTLFHTLTVQAYLIDEETAGGLTDEVMLVLPNIKNYIKYFFTCEECVQNFQKLDQNIDRGEVNTSATVVLWLWTAHNRVNHRLSGDITEDPQHPKIQFPSPEMCPSCRLKAEEDSDEIIWDEVQVLRFLRHFYGKQNIVSPGSDQYGSKTRHHSSYTSGNSSMGLMLIQYPILLLWFLHYVMQNVDSCSRY